MTEEIVFDSSSADKEVWSAFTFYSNPVCLSYNKHPP